MPDQNNELELFAAFDHWLEQNFGLLQSSLLELIAIPSLQQAAEEGAPFGLPVRQALDYTLHLAEQLGFSVGDDQGFCGFADLPGQSDSQIGVLGHLDVVPVSEQTWTSPPFEPQIRQGRIYGRGAVDDKGPLLAALFAAAAICESKVQLKKTVRFIFGCNEESGMACVEHYLQGFAPPEMGFTPDANFPVVVGEKGIIHCSFNWQIPALDSAAASAAENGLQLISLQGGTAANIIPGTAQAALSGSCDLPPAPAGISVQQQGETLLVSASGLAVHASTPEEGENAISLLLAYLLQLPFANPAVSKLLQQLHSWTQDYNGSGLGCADDDGLSRTTLSPTQLQADAAGGRLVLDIRFPLKRKAAHFTDILQLAAEMAGMQLVQQYCAEPLYLGDAHPLAQTLLSVYREFTGDSSAPLVIGGGTYAKTMPNFLAFGADLPDKPKLAHQADEYIDCQHLLDCAKIYARAIYKLASAVE